MTDDALWTAFHEQSLPHAEWNHRAHLRMAWLCLGRFALDEAHLHMRVGIIRLNAAHGTEETAVRGYHETLTRVWFLLVAALRQEDDAVSSEEFVTKHAARLDRNAPLRYYSRERLFSTTARAVFVPPDLEALPGEAHERGNATEAC